MVKKLKYLKHRFKAKKAITRLEISILRAKWLKELKQEENIRILFKFKEKYLKNYYKAATRRYFIKNKPIILI